MRILHVDHSGLPGGGQLGLLRALERPELRHDHEVLLLTAGPVGERLTERGVSTVVLGMEHAGLGELVARRREVRTAVASAAPDLVVANSLRSAVALAVTGVDVPSVYYLRQDMSAASMGRGRRAVFARLLMRRFDAVLANSAWTLTTVPPSWRDRLPSRVATPVCGVADLLPLPPVDPIEGPLRIGWLGRVVAWKGLHVLLEALEAVKRQGFEVRLQVAGGTFHEDDAYASELRERAAGFPVEFLGHVDDVAGFLGDQDVVAHTSTIPEPFGQVVVQAMAAGRAVVAADAGGPTEIITDGHDGLLVPPGDPHALARALVGLASDPSRSASLGTAARATVDERYSDAVLALALEQSLVELLDEVRGP